MYSFFQYYKTLGSIASYVVETYLIFFNFKNWDGYVIGQRICWCAGIKMLPQISRTCNTHYMQVLNFRVKNVSVTLTFKVNNQHKSSRPYYMNMIQTKWYDIPV